MAYPSQGYPAPGYPQGYPQQGTNVVVTNQPIASNVVVMQQARPLRQWSSGMCACFEDCGICWLGLLFGSCYQCHLATEMGESCCVGMCTPAALIPLRVKLRTQENIQGDICDDTVKFMFCGPCALCQLGREVKLVRQRAATGTTLVATTYVG